MINELSVQVRVVTDLSGKQPWDDWQDGQEEVGENVLMADLIQPGSCFEQT